MKKEVTVGRKIRKNSGQWSPPPLPAEIRGNPEINIDWQLLNFLWLDVIDERDRTVL